ncbi:SCO6880 family protein [Streptomyces sp. NPDC053048]|uniref:SCO6880 family protein n=1 Tax=Streptomyces sp. NPDC053048 TaxID=3365694 RepID=UPI0037CDED42
MSAQEPKLYGGWRRSRTMGIGHLNTGQTAVVVVSLIVPILLLNIAGMGTLPVTIPVALVVMVLTVWQRHGTPLLSFLGARLRWQWANWRGETSYRGQFLVSPQALDLPGIVAPTKLLRVADATGDAPVGLVWNQRDGRMSATVLLSPAGALLAPSDAQNGSAAAWGEALARLADEETLMGASVTIQVRPSSGQALADHVKERTDPSAPAAARQAVRELVARAPRASAQLAAWFTLTVDPYRSSAHKPRNPAEAAAETLRVLDGVDLSGAGADIVRRATDADLMRLVRGAFSPADMDAPQEQVAAMTWNETGPVAAEDAWTVYQHDGSYSVSWVLREAPRKPVPYDVLLKLLAPGTFARRVTLAYRVLPTDEAAAVVEREVNASDARAEYRRRTQRSTTRRERVDAAHAERSATEEALGAGLVQWSVYVTTTVGDKDDLPAAIREVEKAAKLSGGLRFRYAYGGQAAAFAVGLPVGVNPLA